LGSLRCVHFVNAISAHELYGPRNWEASSFPNSALNDYSTIAKARFPTHDWHESLSFRFFSAWGTLTLLLTQSPHANPHKTYIVFAKIGQVLITSLGKTRRERKFRTGTKPQPIQLIYKHWVQQVKAVSSLLKVLRTMFIHVTSPKQGGYQSLECGALCLLNYTSIGFSEMRSRSERYLSPYMI